MEDEIQAEPTAVPAAAPEETPAPSQEKDPVEEELEKVEGSKRSKREKLEYTKRRVEQQLAELGDEAPIEEDKPLTLREYRALQAHDAQQTALTMADAIQNESERRLVKHHLENTIRPSGDAKTDLDNARALVEAVRTKQQLEDTSRITGVRSAPSAPSAPPRQDGAKPEFTKEQQHFMRSMGLSEEEAAKALQA